MVVQQYTTNTRSAAAAAGAPGAALIMTKAAGCGSVVTALWRQIMETGRDEKEQTENDTVIIKK